MQDLTSSKANVVAGMKAGGIGNSIAATAGDTYSTTATHIYLHTSSKR